jgi:predicted metal-dependent hydrolase
MAEKGALTVGPGIKVRSPDLRFDARIPRHWLGGNAFATHLSNGINLLFPAGERFFVRSVHFYVDRIADPRLAEQVKAFSGQEGRHAQAHERFFQILAAQGFRLDRFLSFYQRVAFDLIESNTSPALRLAATVACEHFTAILAENALRDRILDRAHPALRDLLFWHAAEEIEHRAVAFDVLRTVCPGYALRMAGLGLATVTLAGFWMAATIDLLVQDEEVDFPRLMTEVRELGGKDGILRNVFLRGIRAYVRRDFHPSKRTAAEHLARQYLERSGLA